FGPSLVLLDDRPVFGQVSAVRHGFGEERMPADRVPGGPGSQAFVHELPAQEDSCLGILAATPSCERDAPRSHRGPSAAVGWSALSSAAKSGGPPVKETRFEPAACKAALQRDSILELRARLMGHRFRSTPP